MVKELWRVTFEHRTRPDIHAERTVAAESLTGALEVAEKTVAAAFTAVAVTRLGEVHV
jgi:hypothetical protein